ncbi:hypothetical protein DER29_6015 [Micromonospora sp. M71_S20]|uniref:hypothetical protein n=1 Tax=Micromonospora sp. M71_S20 TaxID=592872 RepID=UPI000F2BF356|nr:hypothetical protein [Micromonospora sp. M71_S20]RLK09511.1 hypothetical protein DER29_6015 [Micromonospora sp. M71_S20]
MTIGAVERHVQGADEEHTPLDGDGFLDGAAASITLAGDLAGRPGSFVLLAPGGVGKSIVLDGLRRREDGFEVDLVGLRGADIGRAIGAAIASGKPIYLDSLDEAMLTEPALVRLVNRAMSGPGTDGVKWRLACRPSAWTSAFVDGVKNFEKLRLLPMTRDAARRLLACLDVDEGFLDVLAAAGRSRLSASLLHFIAAARQWQEAGRVPGQRADALESEVQRLLTEREELRQPLRTGADMRRRTAGRLAVFAAFGGVGRFAFRTGAGPAAVAIAELPTMPEPDRPDATIGGGVYAEVLGSALFDTAPRDTVAFRHQEYVDYLAAKYVVDRAPTRSQVTALLGLTDGVLPRSIVAVAAWMVALRPEFADLVAPANAAALVESEVDLPPAARAAVVDALLADAREHDAPPRWSLDLSVVVHPDLARQLTDRLAAGVDQPLEAWWLCRLALAGRISAVAPAALTIALDDRLPSWVRRPAIAVVTDLGSASERSALLDGLKLDPDADPDDELRAGLLDGLYPQHMTTTRLLPFVTWPRRVNFIGAYRKFLWEFSARVPNADLPEFLAWARASLQPQVSVESRRWLSDVPIRVVERAVAASDDPAVLGPLAELVVDLAGHIRVGAHWVLDTARRRHLALAAAARLDEQRWTVLLQLGLVTADDIDWLTDAINDQRATGQDVLARCLQRLTAPPAPTDDEQETEEQETEDRPDATALRTAISAARQDLAAWADIPIALMPDNEQPVPLFSCDLTARRGWSLLTSDEQREVLNRGIEYVTGRSPDPGLWLGRASIGLDVVRDWSGVYLLTTLARHAPERLGDLPLTAWARWAPAIANAWAHDDKDLLGDLVDLAPAEATAEIRNAVRVALDSRVEWRRTPLYEYFARDLAPDLAAILPQRRYPDDQNADVLAFLIEHDPQMATVGARSVANGDDSQLSRAANRHLAHIDSLGTINRLLNEPTLPGAFLELLESLPLDTVDDGRLADLICLLLDRLPLADDPRESEDSLDSPAQREARMLNHMVEMLAMRGLATELKVLADGQPPQAQALIRHHLRKARQIAADNAQTHLNPTSLLDLLGRSDLRLIRNSGDLIGALMDHLDDLQHELSRNNGFRDLWSPNGKNLGSEDDITDWLRRRLTDQLGRDRVILTREPQVERIAVKGSGTRIDLTAGTPTNTAPVGVAGAIIEAKLVSNAEVPTALRDQLVQRYLAATGQRHGIYLVYWLPPEQRSSSSRKYADKEELLDDMRRWAAEVAPQFDVSVYVLDVSWPKRQ